MHDNNIFSRDYLSLSEFCFFNFPLNSTNRTLKLIRNLKISLLAKRILMTQNLKVNSNSALKLTTTVRTFIGLLTFSYAIFLCNMTAIKNTIFYSYILTSTKLYKSIHYKVSTYFLSVRILKKHSEAKRVIKILFLENYKFISTLVHHSHS